VEIYQDQTLRKELNNLAKHLYDDTNLSKIRNELVSNPSKFKEKYMIRKQVLHCQDEFKYNIGESCYLNL
jgi:hypothetical protein